MPTKPPMPIERWKPGSQIVVRSRWKEEIQAALPMTVVVDSVKVLVLYLADGTPFKTRSNYSTVHLPVGEWELVDDSWRSNLLRIIYPGDEHAYFAMWNGNRFSCWYVNLESPYRRTSLGIDYEDHILDVVIQPDLKSWEWKDADELAEAVSLGLVSQFEADSIRAEGHRALARLKARSSPFADGWERWTPDSTWPIPKLPADWWLS